MYPRPGYPPPPYQGAPPYAAPPYSAAMGYGPQAGAPFAQAFPPRGLPHPSAAPAARRPPGAAPAKSTTLWVGKIAPTVEPPLARALLEACGVVREWKPATDHQTGGIKGFGFCTFRDAEGVLVALQVLDDLNVDGMKLKLKCNSATDEYINWYKANALAREQPAADAPGGEAGAEPNEARDAASAKVASLLVGRAPVAPSLDAAAAANEFLSSLGGPAVEAKVESIDVRRIREQDAADAALAQQRQREQQRQLDQEEREYKEALRKWEQHERERQREVERELDRKRDLEKERARQLRADNEAPDTDQEEEPWRWRPYSASRRAVDRRRRRAAELQEEEEDKIRERAQQLAQEQAEREAARLAAEARAAAAAGELVAPPAAPQLSVGARAAAEPALAPRRAVPRPTFVDDEEEEAQPTRKLVVLQYSDAEQQAMQVGHEAAEPQPQRAPGQLAPPDTATVKKQLMASIPKTQEAVFAYPMKWAQVEHAPQDVMERIAGWVSKKIKELMGEDDASFCSYIMSQVKSRTGAAEMLENLRDVLDEDAEKFIMKLFQVLIYETEKLASQ